jgi:tetratricopeptide (TPR) repeat protein
MPVVLQLILLVTTAAVLLGQPPSLETPAEKAIARAREAIEKNSKNTDAYNQLAMALARRARETADTSKYDEARAVLDKLGEIAPDNFGAQRTRVWLLLGKHEFTEAAKLAKALNERMPDDHTTYGLLADAYVELGKYQEAETAVQWMLDLSRGSIPALTRAAYLRELFGDIEGSRQLLESVYERIRPEEVEERAWILTHIGHLRLLTREFKAAETTLKEALRLFPGYHYALGNMARVRTAQGRHADAADLLQTRYHSAPHPENLYDLGVALKRAGKIAKARKAFVEFERKARAEMNSWDNANRELIFYYTDHVRKPGEALRIAKLEIDRRQDTYTQDAYAWALHMSGRHAEAREQIDTALSIGVRDPKLLAHAKVIRGAIRL